MFAPRGHCHGGVTTYLAAACLQAARSSIAALCGAGAGAAGRLPGVVQVRAAGLGRGADHGARREPDRLPPGGCDAMTEWIFCVGLSMAHAEVS